MKALFLIGALFIVVASGATGAYLDIKGKTRDSVTYWMLGAIAGLVAGVLVVMAVR